MMFLYSLKLFGSNWIKALKFLLCYIVIWGICFAIFLPSFFAFKDIVFSSLAQTNIQNSVLSIFGGNLGEDIRTLVQMGVNVLSSTFQLNAGLCVYGLVVMFVVLPFLVNVAKYAFCEMLYSYMTSKNKTGFFSALVRSLKKSLLFALAKTFYNLLFLTSIGLCVYALCLINNPAFVHYGLPLIFLCVLVIFLSLEQITILGWMPALIVFDCNIFVAYRRGFKAVCRHFWATFGTTILYFLLFWVLCFLFGIYSMIVLVPLLTILLCVYNMVSFFCSQGMRFYYNENNILTPKKLEEVDSFKKNAYILWSLIWCFCTVEIFVNSQIFVWKFLFVCLLKKYIFWRWVFDF